MWKHAGERGYRLTVPGRQDDYVEPAKLMSYLEKLQGPPSQPLVTTSAVERRGTRYLCSASACRPGACRRRRTPGRHRESGAPGCTLPVGTAPVPCVYHPVTTSARGPAPGRAWRSSPSTIARVIAPPVARSAGIRRSSAVESPVATASLMGYRLRSGHHPRVRSRKGADMLLVGSDNARVGFADGMRILRHGGHALDAVEATIRRVEAIPPTTAWVWAGCRTSRARWSSTRA